MRGEAFLTNAVKHFKCEPRGKRRHPGADEQSDIDIRVQDRS